jgi:hypothetical protein
LAIFQTIGISLALEGQAGLVIDPGMAFRITAIGQPSGWHHVSDIGWATDHRARGWVMVFRF